jgi:glutamine amidotransferase
MKIVIIDYGAGNIFSVQTALRRLGYEAVLSNEVGEISSADRVIFPGVGQASAAMQQLTDKGLAHVIPQLTMPVLGICLGMQLMCRHSEEEDAAGLGIFPVDVLRITGADRVPHMGWNTLHNLQSPLFQGVGEGERMYFVHSYYVPLCAHTIAESEYPSAFSAAIRKNNFYGCQFHPEKSSAMGERVLLNFLTAKL